jgi:adenylate kinase
MKVIVVTGTPGTGKTKLAKKIAKKNKYLYVDVKKLIKNFKLNECFDKKRKSWIIDIKKLNNLLISVIKTAKFDKLKGLVFDSHLAHYLPKKYVNLCIVTRTEPKRLYQRLKQRHYSKSKIQENMEAEIMQIILEEARQRKHKIRVIWT